MVQNKSNILSRLGLPVVGLVLREPSFVVQNPVSLSHTTDDKP